MKLLYICVHCDEQSSEHSPLRTILSPATCTVVSLGDDASPAAGAPTEAGASEASDEFATLLVLQWALVKENSSSKRTPARRGARQRCNRKRGRGGSQAAAAARGGGARRFIWAKCCTIDVSMESMLLIGAGGTQSSLPPPPSSGPTMRAAPPDLSAQSARKPVVGVIRRADGKK